MEEAGGETNNMTFYPPRPRRRPIPPGMRPRGMPPNQMGLRPRPFISPNQNQQEPTSRFDGLKTMMGHVGNVTNGINMLRGLGSFFRIL